MGIRPRKGGSYLPPVPDSSTSRWGDWVDDLDSAGGAAGEGFEEIDAKASSGNAGVADLAGRLDADLTALEGRVDALETPPVSTASGTGWSVSKKGNVAQLEVNGATTGFTLPEGFRPAVRRRETMFGAGQIGRVLIATNGAVSFYDGLAPDVVAVYGGSTFII